MDINTIVKRVNKQLAGEQLVYSQMEEFLDSTIDDINAALNSTFPTFSELSADVEYAGETEYDYFPERYIRSVVIPGAAYKFYIMDEEGMVTAEQFAFDYQQGLFLMQRDYMEQVPEEYRSENSGSIRLRGDFSLKPTPFDFDVWR